MKPFFGREVIERPRSGSSNRSAKARKFGRIVPDEETGFEYYGETKIPSFMGGRAEHYHKKRGDKSFYVLGPLTGYLRKSCGLPWNEVYSELTAELGRFSWPLRHILTQHVNVAVKTYRGVDGKVWHCDRNSVHAIGSGYGWRDEFYVEPETGLLRRAKLRKWRYTNDIQRKDTDRVALKAGLWGVLIDGLWYIGRYSEVQAEDAMQPEWPNFQAGFRSKSTWVFAKQNQANRKEIKAIERKRSSRM
jgi:hypothetical protein